MYSNRRVMQDAGTTNRFIFCALTSVVHYIRSEMVIFTPRRNFVSEWLAS